MRTLIFFFFIAFTSMAFSQGYSPAFYAYYEQEEAALRQHYDEAEVEEELKFLYRDWVEEIKVERADLANRPESEERNKRIKALNSKQEMLQAYISGEDFIPEEEPEEVVQEEPEPVKEEEPELVQESEPETVVEKEPKPTPEPEPEPEPMAKEPEPAPSSTEEMDRNALLAMYNNPIEGVYFRIQVAATNTQKTGADVQAILGIQEEVIEEEHNGLYKYLVGKFSRYSTAKEKADQLKANAGVNAFVVGYKNEQRTDLGTIFAP